MYMYAHVFGISTCTHTALAGLMPIPYTRKDQEESVETVTQVYVTACSGHPNSSPTNVSCQCTQPMLEPKGGVCGRDFCKLRSTHLQFWSCCNNSMVKSLFGVFSLNLSVSLPCPASAPHTKWMGGGTFELNCV